MPHPPINDYSVVDDIIVGRIYRQLIHGEPKWLWFLQTDPASPPNSGMADMCYSIGRAMAHLAVVVSSQRNRIRAEVYLWGDNAKAFFGLLISEGSSSPSSGN